MNSSRSKTLLSWHASIKSTGTHIYQKMCIFRADRVSLTHSCLESASSTSLPCLATWAAIKLSQHKPQDRGLSLHNRSQFLKMEKSRNRELSICSPTERQGTSYKDLQIGNIPYILDTGRVGKKKKYICWAEEATRANQRLGNLCRVPFKTFCENVLTLVLNVKNKSFPSFFLKDGAL